MKRFLGVLLLSVSISPQQALFADNGIEKAISQVKENIKIEMLDKNPLNQIIAKVQNVATTDPAIWTYATAFAVTGPILWSINIDNHLAAASTAIIGLASIYPLHHYLYGLTKQGKADKQFSIAKKTLDTTIKEKLKTISNNLEVLNDTYDIDIDSCEKAELCSEKMCAASEWPLIDLRKKLHAYFVNIEQINRDLQSIEKFFSKKLTIYIKQNNAVKKITQHDYWLFAKEATANLAAVLSESIKHIHQTKAFQDQDNKLKENRERSLDRQEAGKKGSILYSAKYKGD